MKNILTTSILALAGLVFVAPATFANTSYVDGHLVVGFQKQGDSDIVQVTLGDTALIFRDATSDLINIQNANAALTAAFGAGWFNDPAVFIGAVGVWRTSETSLTLQNGDPSRTLYVTRERQSVGTLGQADSNPWSVGTPGTALIGGAGTTAAGNIASALAGFRNSPTNSSSLTLLDTETTYETQNPFLIGLQQGTGYGTFAGGVQDAFGPGIFGTIGGINAEAALDLYRIQMRSDRPGQYGENEQANNGLGEYQGTLVIDSLGNLSFLNAVAPVPEPGTVFFGVALLGAFGSRRLRKRQSQKAIVA